MFEAISLLAYGKGGLVKLFPLFRSGTEEGTVLGARSGRAKSEEGYAWNCVSGTYMSSSETQKQGYGWG